MQLQSKNNFILANSLTEKDVRLAIEKGQTYFCYETEGTGNALAPRINNILIDEQNQTITIICDSGMV